tara:strand:- start:89 stop:226 length:138 start_codon:yes stop_codon:yes gene_type:complete
MCTPAYTIYWIAKTAVKNKAKTYIALAKKDACPPSPKKHIVKRFY